MLNKEDNRKNRFIVSSFKLNKTHRPYYRTLIIFTCIKFTQESLQLCYTSFVLIYSCYVRYKDEAIRSKVIP